MTIFFPLVNGYEINWKSLGPASPGGQSTEGTATEIISSSDRDLFCVTTKF